MLPEDEFATPRFSLVLFGIFGVIGSILAVVGVCGVMSTAVAQQRHEIGVRPALGAERGRIVRMIARGARLMLAGVAVGLVASILAVRAIAGQVWNVAAFDPAAFAISKSIPLGNGMKLDLLAQVFNALNTDSLQAQYGGGRVTNALSDGFGTILTARPATQGELAAKVSW